MAYANPVPGGTVGRTDMGVDVSAAPGTPVRAIADETLVGVLQNWYKGQPFYWFKQKGTNIYNYVAEQFQSKLKVGQSVQQGQEIGTVAPSGTGLELGWATASGQTAAQATTGYTEGQPTPAGTSYRDQVIKGGKGITRPGGASDAGAGGPSGVGSLLSAYTGLRDNPRTAPPGTKNPTKWFLASFTGQWDKFATASPGTAPPAAGGGDNSGKVYGQVPYDMVLSLSKQAGWDQAEADVWFNNLIPSESNGTLTATNPKSRAYGVAQGITGPRWYFQYGGSPGTMMGQLTAMKNYIKGRYGTPSAAWAFHKKNNWY